MNKRLEKLNPLVGIYGIYIAKFELSAAAIGVYGMYIIHNKKNHSLLYTEFTGYDKGHLGGPV